MRTALFWVVTQREVVMPLRKGFLTLEYGTDRLDRNVGKELPLLAARSSTLRHGGSLKSGIPQGRWSLLTPHPSPRSAYPQTLLCSPQETETGVLFLCASRIFLHPSAMIHTG